MICTGCTQEKPVTEFYRNRAKASGYERRCKTCWASWYKKPLPKRKRCGRCEVFKPVRAFAKRLLGLQAICKSCMVAINRQSQVRLRLEVLTQYSPSKKFPQCSCMGCKETRIPFLTLDHINNDGARHRRELAKELGRRDDGRSSGTHVYLDVKRRGFPPGFQTLCWNCNCGRRLNGGLCPHLTQAVLTAKS
jgi:hypothetical protein